MRTRFFAVPFVGLLAAGACSSIGPGFPSAECVERCDGAVIGAGSWSCPKGTFDRRDPTRCPCWHAVVAPYAHCSASDATCPATVATCDGGEPGTCTCIGGYFDCHDTCGFGRDAGVLRGADASLDASTDAARDAVGASDAEALADAASE